MKNQPNVVTLQMIESLVYNHENNNIFARGPTTTEASPVTTLVAVCEHRSEGSRHFQPFILIGCHVYVHRLTQAGVSEAVLPTKMISFFPPFFSFLNKSIIFPRICSIVTAPRLPFSCFPFFFPGESSCQDVTGRHVSRFRIMLSVNDKRLPADSETDKPSHLG